ncbi:MAG TPA: DNA repair protein RecN [Bacteroidales bacterium]|nr:DNA repair protein RecN [Bacteroidales bacterium]
MLTRLYVQNYALIRELDIPLQENLTVITGETGAGKSILLGALSLVLGARADTNVLLDKSLKCVVEGTFLIKEYDLKGFFKANELDYDHVSIIRREINPAGKSRAFINDTPVNLNILKDLGERLIDIHSQHQTLMLSENTFQMSVIDSFAGNMKLLGEYKALYSNYKSLKKEYEELLEKSDRNKADLEYYKAQLIQLEEARLKAGEQDELEREQEVLEHTEEIKSSLESAGNLLASDDAAILNQIRDVKSSISKIKDYLPEAESLLTRIDSAYIELDDISTGLSRISSRIEADPERLKIVGARLDLIYSLAQKHRVKTTDELIAKKQELERLVNGIASSDERMEELNSLIEKELKVMSVVANQVSERRGKIVPEVEEKISGMLRQLGMPNARFRVELTRLQDFSATGIDKADLLFSANKQVPPENLAKVASGGELSRVMLSLKSLLARNLNLPTIIFDEIDSGVSGEVADKVGQILSEMGKYMQVINITHLPQVAARGREHLHVYKDDTRSSTITRIKLLTPDERILEIARLLSGSEITETSKRNAKELLEAATE